MGSGEREKAASVGGCRARELSRVLGALRIVALLSVVPWPGSAVSAQATSVFDFPDRMWVVDGIQVPSVADTFALVDVRRWPRLNLGFSLQYATPLSNRADLNLYVYPVPAERRNLDETEVINSEFEAAVRGIYDYNAANRAGASITIDVEQETSLDLSNGEAVNGMHAEGTFERSETRRPTLLYVFVKGDHYLKYRISFDVEDRKLLEPHFTEWIRLTYEAVGPQTPRQPL